MNAIRSDIKRLISDTSKDTATKLDDVCEILLRMSAFEESAHTISLSDEEKQWLHGVMQNPFVSYNDEDPLDRAMREAIFHKTE